MADLSQYQPLFDTAEQKYKLPPGLLPLMAKQESNGNPRAVSDAGAAGLMQFTKPTADEVGIKDRFDPAQSIDGAGKYMAQLLDHYDGDKRKALAAYNYGRGNVDRLGDQYDESRLPLETRGYLANVADKHDSLSQSQAPAAPAATRKVSLTQDGVTFSANVPEDWTTEQIQSHFRDNPVPHSYLIGKAADQGKYVDLQTGEIKDYSNIQKFMIGAGKAVNDVTTGTQQWVQQAMGNADGVRQIAQQTAAEKELYDHLDTGKGLQPQDVGQVLANAAVLFGPGGIVGAAARAGMFEAAKATDDPTGDAGGRAARGAAVAAGVGAVGGAGMLLGKAVGYIGLKNLASIAAPVIAEVATGHGALTAGAIVAMRAALGTGGASGRLASQFLKFIGKEAENPITKQLGDLMTDGGTPDAAKMAAAAVIQQRAEAALAKQAAAQADAARKAQALVDQKLAQSAPQGATPAQTARMGTPRRPPSALERDARATDVYEEIIPVAGRKPWQTGAKADPTGGRTRAAIEEDPALNTLRGMQPAGTPYLGPSAAHDVPLPPLKASDIMPTSPPKQFY